MFGGVLVFGFFKKNFFCFFYLDAPNAVHVKYSCLVSNGIKKGHLLVSCSHQSGKAPLASAKGSCGLMQGKQQQQKKVFLILDSCSPKKFVTKYTDTQYTEVRSFHLCVSMFLPTQQLLPPLL